MKTDRDSWKAPLVLFEEAAQLDAIDLSKSIEDTRSILELACLVGGLAALRINEEFKAMNPRIGSGLPEDSSVRPEVLLAARLRLERTGGTYPTSDIYTINPLDSRLLLAIQERPERPAYALACMSALLKHGANPNSLVLGGLGPLHLLVIRTDTAGVNLLLDSGADVNLETAYWDTPLTLAIKQRSAVMIDVLLARGANVTDKNGDLKTPYDLALESGDASIIRRIEDSLGMSGSN